MIVQSAAAANLRGRAESLYVLASRCGTALGALASGFSVELVGIRNALLIKGARAVAAQVQIGRVWRQQPAITNH